MDMQLNRCDYTIMEILKEKDAINPVRGLTSYEISAIEQITNLFTIQKKIKKLQELGYLAEGVKAGHAKTYYLTDVGVEMIPSTLYK